LISQVNSRGDTKGLYIVFFSVLVIRLAIAALMWPGADEAYYYLYTLNPALSYFDHPPMVALAGGLIPAIFNWVTPLSLRLGPILLFSVSVIYFHKTADFFLDNKAKKFATIIFMIVPMFFISGTVLLPDAALILFWNMGIYYLIKAIRQNRLSSWIMVGIAAGLAMLSKYTGGFLYIGGLLYIFIRRKTLRKERKILLSYGPWLAAAISLLIFSPVIIWNINNDFASFAFQTSRVGVGGVKFRYFYQSIFGQMGYLFPFFFFPGIYYAFKSIAGLKSSDRFRKFIFAFGAVPVLLFLFMALFKRVLPHWPVIGYIILTLPVAKYYLGLSNKRPKLFKFYAAAHAGLVLVAIAAVLIQVHTGFIFNREVKLGHKAEKKDVRDITIDIIGWDKLADYFSAGTGKISCDFLFTNKWYLAGQIGFALKGNYPLMVLSSAKDARGFIMWQDQNKFIGKDGIFITTSKFFKDPEEKYRNYFEDIKLIDTINIERAGKVVKIIYLYRCSNLKKPYPVN
jgi:hypothetical protein